MEYTPITLEHAENPRNVGEMEHPDGHCSAENPICGDTVEFWIKLGGEGQIIEDIVFKAFGCLAVSASASMLSVMVKGKSVSFAAAVSEDSLENALGGLPPAKRHGASLALEAMQGALEEAERVAGCS